jgi:hypothetical protein
MKCHAGFPKRREKKSTENCGEMIKQKRLKYVFAALFLCAASLAGIPAEVSAQSVPARVGTGESASAANVKKGPEGALKLTPEGERLLRDSKAAILATGFSERFFDAHFKPYKVFNSPADRRVVWRFQINGHEALINDAVGFYTDEKGRRVDTHTVADTLGSTRDIRRTISRRRAERVMKACIGEYEGAGAIIYQRFGNEPRAALLFTAVSTPPPAEPASPNATPAQTTPAPAPSTEAQQVGAQEGANAPPDSVAKRKGGIKKPFLSIGSVNLETGRCTKGVAQVGSPQPTPPEKTRPAPAPRRRR